MISLINHCLTFCVLLDPLTSSGGCGAQKLALVVLLNHFFILLVLRQDLSLDLELMDLATPADQQSLRICMYVSCTPDSVVGL